MINGHFRWVKRCLSWCSNFSLFLSFLIYEKSFNFFFGEIYLLGNKWCGGVGKRKFFFVLRFQSIFNYTYLLGDREIFGFCHLFINWFDGNWILTVFSDDLANQFTDNIYDWHIVAFKFPTQYLNGSHKRIYLIKIYFCFSYEPTQ